MTEKRFTLDDENDDIIFDNNTITDSGIKEIYWLIDCDQRQKLVDLLNALHEEKEQQQKSFDGLAHNWKIMYDEAKQVISDLEKENEKLKKQLRELENDSTKSRNDREKNCGYCKNYNFDGMFGIWCSIHETPTSDKYCQDFEWNR